MKDLICKKCNTNFRDFISGRTYIRCKCDPDSKYDICSGI